MRSVELLTTRSAERAFRLADQFDLAEYLRVLRRRWLWILAGLLSVVALGYIWFYVYNAPIYESTATIRVLNESADDALDPTVGRFRDLDRTMNNEVALAQSDLIQQEAALLLGTTETIAASVERGIDVLRLTATDESADRAADIANAFATTYITERRRLATEEYRSAAVVVEDQLQLIDQEIDQLADVPDQVQALDSLITQREVIIRQLQALRLNAALGQGGTAQIIGEAVAPDRPSSPKPLRDGLLVGVLGLMMGIGLAFVAEHLSDAVHDADRLEALLGVPVIARFPALGSKMSLSETSQTPEPLIEPVSSLRLSTEIITRDVGTPVVAITSAVPGDGKSTVAANLALAYARAGQSVMLIDFDTYRPRLHDVFGIRLSPGVTSILNGSNSLVECDIRLPSAVGLRLVPAGESSDHIDRDVANGLEGLLDQARAESDVVIVDCPPVLPVAQTVSMTTAADATILVYRSGHTPASAAEETVSKLQRAGTNLVGTVLNGMDASAVNYRYYGYKDAATKKQRSGSGREAITTAESAPGTLPTQAGAPVDAGRNGTAQPDGAARPGEPTDSATF